MNQENNQAELPLEKLSYEDALAELEQIVTILESDNQSLENSLKLFERGRSLAQHCAGLLDQADVRIHQLMGETLQPFAPTEVE